MTRFSNKAIYIKFLVYIVVVVLLNVAGITLFFRADLTANRIYSLSDAGRAAVSHLTEPLTIKVFFTRNLPAPHNTTERYLHDLLEMYADTGGRRFNYTFYDVNADDTAMNTAMGNRQLAQDYGISPVQIRIIENDEIKFKQAYMGLVIIHGDMIEKIPAITATDGLEYALTTAIEKLNNKVSALMALPEKVQVRLYLSSSLEPVAPLMGLERFSSLPGEIQKVIDKLSRETLGNIDYRYEDPSDEADIVKLADTYNIMRLTWPEIPQENIKAGSGVAGVVISYQDQVRAVPLISSINLPIIGTTYQMADPAGLETLLSDTMETMIGINEKLGYLADHGTLALSPGGMAMMGRPQGNMNAFNQLISRRYSLTPVTLEEGIPQGMKTLIIARPTEPFSEYELFQIDQALMRGTNIAFFTDAFKESPSPGGMGMGPQILPIDSGLEKLLAHYGVSIEKSIVLDENCYRQPLPQQQGGGEQLIYFAPIIKDQHINQTPAYMNNIKGLIAMQISPVNIDPERLAENDLTATRLFSSSEQSWTMADNIHLNPMFIQPPPAEEMKSHPLAYLVTGAFPSYFKGRTLPKKTSAQDNPASGNADDADGEKATEPTGPAQPVADIKTENPFITQGENGKIFVMACSAMLQDNMLDPQGQSTNATFILNVVDHLNDDDVTAALRSKNQTFNPLAETGTMTRNIIKSAAIAGLPVLVILTGFIVLLMRKSRKRRIRRMFQTLEEDTRS